MNTFKRKVREENATQRTQRNTKYKGKNPCGPCATFAALAVSVFSFFIILNSFFVPLWPELVLVFVFKCFINLIFNSFIVMKTILAALFLACMNLLVAGPSSSGLIIKHLTGDFYIYTTFRNMGGKPFPSNSMYMLSADGVVMFDTPWDTTQFQPLLDSIWAKHHQKVISCVVSHFHEDRTAGLDFLNQKGIKTFSSALTWNLCRQHHENEASYRFTSDTVFSIGGHTFETFYPGEGHTKDNIVIWFDKEKILYGGCLVKSTDNNSLGYIADANLDAWGETIQHVMNKYPNAQFVIPGHFS